MIYSFRWKSEGLKKIKTHLTTLKLTKTKKMINHLKNNKHIQAPAVKAGEVDYIYKSVTIDDIIYAPWLDIRHK